MRVIGFNFTKIFAERPKSFKRGSISTNVEFIDFDKEKVEFLKETDVAKLSFKYSVVYDSSEDKKADKKAEISLEGIILLDVTKDELKELQKNWKKKNLSARIKIPLFNLILKKCSPKTMQLQDELNLPTHLPIPQIKPQAEPK